MLHDAGCVLLVVDPIPNPIVSGLPHEAPTPVVDVRRVGSERVV